MPNLLDKIRSALKRPTPTTAQLADALADARKAEAEARAAVEKAAAVVAAGFMDAAAKRQADRDALAKAREDAEDAGLVLAEVERRHAEALAADEQTRRRMLYDAAKAEADAAAAAVRKDYPRLARDLVALLGRLAKAQQAVAMVNAELPADAAHLEDPEFAARGVLGQPAQIVSEEEVVLWKHTAERGPTSPEMARTISDVGKGWGRGTGAHSPYFRRHRFVKRTIRPATYNDAPAPLAATVQLPAVLGSGLVWEASAHGQTLDADDVLARLAALDAAAVAMPVKAERALKVEWEDLGEVTTAGLDKPEVVSPSSHEVPWA